MTTSADPQDIERNIVATRDRVDPTHSELEDRFSVRRRLGTARAAAVDRLCPNITTMIRLDHSHVLAAFRRFRSDLAPGRKRALVANVCLALDVHAQLEEEIFYPALKDVAGENEALAKSVPEHDEMRALIATLRQLGPQGASFDDTFRKLMRTVLHHVADEETILLPLAEERLPNDLGRLGWEMTKRRMELLGPHMAEAATTTARTFPVGSAVAVASVMTLGFLLVRGAVRGRH
jgi:hemerythrin superfamily protein